MSASHPTAAEKKKAAAKKAAAARARTDAAQAKKDAAAADKKARATGSGAARATPADGTDRFHPIHGRYRDEASYNLDRNIFLVRRTFLASKVEFEVEVPNAGLGKTVAEINRLSIGERDQLVIAAAQGLLDLRTRQLSEDLDNSDLGGEQLASPRSTGTVGGVTGATSTQAGRYVETALVAGSGGPSPTDEAANRKGEEAATTGAAVAESKLVGSPNDRTKDGTGTEIAKGTIGADGGPVAGGDPEYPAPKGMKWDSSGSRYILISG